MSFLIDPPLLVASGAAYAKVDGERPGAAVAAATALFWGVGAALYMNRRWTVPLSRLFGARDGRDFMINSGVLRIPYRPESRRTHFASAAAFATYPLWFLAGWKLAHG